MFGRTLWLFFDHGYNNPAKIVHNSLIEFIWTVVPSFFLMAIAIPSFALLYCMDEVIEPLVTLKAIGHQ
jgi:cytochrome c oxidase subunit 2